MTGVYNVTLIYNTGFNSTNYPDGDIKGVEQRKFKAIYSLQDKILPSIRINTLWETVKNADYCFLEMNNKKTYYIINHILMINENVAELSLQVDPFATIGINNIEVVTGWCLRAHVRNDTLFSNILPEPFTPSQGSQIKIKELDVDKDYFILIASSIDLEKVDFIAKQFKDNKTGWSTIKPWVEGTTVSTKIDFPSFNVKKAKFQKTLGGICLYELSDIPKKTLDILQSLGMMDCILASYIVPKRFIYNQTLVKSGIKITELVGDGVGYTGIGLPFIYGNALNNKCFASFNQYHLISPTSGGRQTFEAYEINNNTVEPTWTVNPDVSPMGKTYARPEYYKGINHDEGGVSTLISTVSGSVWRNHTLVTTGGSGYAVVGKLASLTSALAENNIRSLGVQSGVYNSIESNQSNYVQSGASLGKQGNNINRTMLNAVNNAQRVQVSQTTINNLFDAIQPKKPKNNVLDKILPPNLQPNGLASSVANDAFNIYKAEANYKKNMDMLANNDALIDLQLQNSLISNQLSNQLQQISLTTGMNNARLQLQKELVAYTQQSQLQSPTLSFPVSDNLSEYLGNGFIVVQEMLCPEDLKRYDEYLTRFGYAQSKPLNIDDFKNRKNFNFVQASDVTIKDKTKNQPQWLIEHMYNLLLVGVRIWHQPVTKANTLSNPIK